MKTKAMIQFKQENVDGEGAGKFRYFSLCVEDVFRIEKVDNFTNRIFYGIMGDANTKCLACTVNWNSSNANAGDVNQMLWKYIIRANNSPGSCETVTIPNSDGGELYATNLLIEQQTLPTA